MRLRNWGEGNRMKEVSVPDKDWLACLWRLREMSWSPRGLGSVFEGTMGSRSVLQNINRGRKKTDVFRRLIM